MGSISAKAQNTYNDEFVSVAILATLFIKHMAFELYLFCCIYLYRML